MFFSGVSQAAVQKWAGTQRPPRFWDLLCAHSIINNNQVLHCDQTKRDENFYTVDREC